MKNFSLFPHWVRKPGWVAFSLGLVFGLALLFNFDVLIYEIKIPVFVVYSDGGLWGESAVMGFINTDIFDEFVCILIVVGGILIIFSKEKIEDEFISRIRLDSLMWAVIIHYAVFLVVTLFIHGTSYLTFTYINLFTILIYFIIIYNWSLINWKRRLNNEE